MTHVITPELGTAPVDWGDPTMPSHIFSALLFVDYPVLCGHNSTCTCYHDLTNKMNVLHCSGPRHTNISDIIGNIPESTNLLILDETNITELCDVNESVSESITKISVISGQLSHICDESLDWILVTVTYLNLANNKLTNISPHMKSMTHHLTELWLGGNPIECDCSMTWMIDFLTNSSLPSGDNLVKDYMDVTCADSVYYGTPVYMLNPVEMGCYPRNLPIWIIKVASTIGGGAIIFVVLLLIIYHKWVLVRWLVYKYTGKLIGGDKQIQDLSGIEYDAFLSYRYSATLYRAMSC